MESHAQSTGAVGEAFLYGYLSELYTSPRHASVDPAYRHAVVVHVLQYYAEHLAQHEELPEDDPPFLSRQRRAFWVAVNSERVSAQVVGSEKAT